MKKSNPDYFAMKPVRGSSPTASLAADLSQNFHIDQRLVAIVILESSQLRNWRANWIVALNWLHLAGHCSLLISLDPAVVEVQLYQPSFESERWC